MEGPNLDDRRESISQFPVAIGHIEIVNALHLRQEGLIDKPLIGNTDFNDFMGTRIEFRLREQNHDASILCTPVGCVQQSLMRPSLNNAFAG